MAYPDLVFQFAKEVSTQLITIASALIGVSITFIKDFRPDAERWFRLSWLSYIVSIIFGIVALMALTGALAVLARTGEKFSDFTTPVKLFAGMQIIAFLAATIFLIVFGWLQSMRPRPKATGSHEPIRRPSAASKPRKLP
jgi:hypothetical protein